MNAKKLGCCMVTCAAFFLVVINQNCGDDTPSGGGPLDTDSVVITATPPGTITAGQATLVQGTIVASETPTVTYRIVDRNSPPSGSLPSLQYQSVNLPTFSLNADAQLTIKSSAQTCNGNYWLIVDAVSGTASKRDTVSFSIAGGKTCGAPIDTAVISATLAGTITAGQATLVHGTILASQVPTVTYTLIDRNTPAADSAPSIQYQVVSQSQFSLDLDAQLTVQSSAQTCNGNYWLIVNVVSGTATDRDTLPFSISGGRACNSADVVEITIGLIGGITAGTQASVTGTATGTSAVSLTYSILDSTGSPVAGSAVSWTATALTGKKNINLAADAQLKISTTAAACNGRYALEIEAASGTATVTKTAQFTITGGVDCSQNPGGLVTVTDTLGSWQNGTYGSSLDVDNMQVYLAPQITTTVQASIDVWFSNPALAEAWLWSPYAAAAGGFAPKTWTTKNATEFKTVTANFSQITTQAQIDALWDANPGDQTLPIVAGDVVVVKTVQGLYRILKIISADTDNVGKAVVQGKR